MSAAALPGPWWTFPLWRASGASNTVGGAIRIGAATTWTDIVKAPLPAAFDALKQAAREVGSIQIQNRGTIGGNLCNASPAADGVPPLLALDATVELASARGRRLMPLSSFITGYRATALAQGEILSAVFVPSRSPQARSAFVKLGARRYLVISILMAAALVERDGDGRISRVAIAVGAASPVARRLPELEAALAGLDPGERPSLHVRDQHLVDSLSHRRCARDGNLPPGSRADRRRRGAGSRSRSGTVWLTRFPSRSTARLRLVKQAR